MTEAGDVASFNQGEKRITLKMKDLKIFVDTEKNLVPIGNNICDAIQVVTVRPDPIVTELESLGGRVIVTFDDVLAKMPTCPALETKRAELPEDVASGDVRYAQYRAYPRGIGSLPDARRAQKHEFHDITQLLFP
jgi:hypothetical protein